jgi:hypothetical protein
MALMLAITVKAATSPNAMNRRPRRPTCNFDITALIISPNQFFNLSLNVVQRSRNSNEPL